MKKPKKNIERANGRIRVVKILERYGNKFIDQDKKVLDYYKNWRAQNQKM